MYGSDWQQLIREHAALGEGHGDGEAPAAKRPKMASPQSTADATFADATHEALRRLRSKGFLGGPAMSFTVDAMNTTGECAALFEALGEGGAAGASSAPPAPQ